MKKRLLSLALAFVLAFSLLPTAAWAAETDVSALPEFSKGADTSTIQKFKISSADSLKALATAVKDNDGKGAYNLKGLTFYLANDIELSGKWTPISDVAYPADAFAGTFDGNGHTISGLNGSNGLFGFVNGATIKNLKVEGTISGPTTGIGGIVGKTQGKVTITNCSFTGSVSATNSGSSNAAGGIVGRVNAGTLKVENCANHATVTAEKASAAGIIGYGGSNKVTITNCYNDGAISGQWYPSGICAQNTNNKSTIQECFNSGSISNTNGGTYHAGISANFKRSATDCYRTKPSSENFGNNKNGASTLLENSDAVKNKLTGIGFLVSDDGKVSLPWEAGGTPAEKNPRIVISGGSTLQMTNSGEQPHTTLTVAYKDMEDSTPTVTWSTSNDCVTLTAPANASAADNIRIAQANEPGTVTITATVTYNGESYSDSVVITVIPHITYVDIINPTSSVIAPGQTVEAQVSVGGKPYLASYPELKYQWWRYDTSTLSAEKITNATEKSYTIPEDYTYNRIQVEVTCNGVTVSAHDQHKTADVLSGDDALLALDKAALTLEKLGVSSTTITAETMLTLPDKGGNGSTITWGSSDSSVIDPMTGKVTLPAEGERKVTLTATLTLNDKKAELPITFVVKSKTAQAVDADKETLEKAAKALSVLYPTFGKDSNVQTMVETRLANAGISGVGVKFISAEPTNATAVQASAISSIGGITYFYDDPNKTVNERTQWFDTYKAYFTLTCGSEARENVEVPVTVYWDEARVKDAMCEEILSRVVLPETVEANLDLPKVVDGKKWTLIEWTSSDRAITISTEKQGTADTLFDPYVGVVTRQTLDQQVELTAKFTFQLADQQIVLYKVFYVTVKGRPERG